MTKIGICPGTFNPIHNEHLAFAQNALDQFDLDKILFVIARYPKFKIGNSDLASYEDRKAMTKLACQSNPKFKVSDLEDTFTQPADKPEQLRLMFPNIDQEEKPLNLHMVIGTDNFNKLDRYNAKDMRIMANHVNFLVHHRQGDLIVEPPIKDLEGNPLTFKYNIVKEEPTAKYSIPKTVGSISSTLIRERLLNNQSITDLVPPAVADYIQDKKLYQNQTVGLRLNQVA